MNAARKRVMVQRGGHIEVEMPELPEGSTAEVIVLRVDAVRRGDHSLKEMIGKGAGAYSTPEEADGFLRSERDSWI